MNLPVTMARGFSASRDSQTIFVGAKALTGSGATLDAIGGAGLKAGDGAVIAFAQGGRPAVAVLGGDENGLASAAVMLAGHLPYLWDQKGPTTGKIADEVKPFLTGKGVTASSAAASAVFTRAGASGVVERVTVALQMANGGDFVKAMVALNQFKATSARDPKRPLSYAVVKALHVKIRATSSGPVTIELPRAAAPEQAAASQPPARRPGGGAKENFDLSSFYTNEGALADSDNNLIPDRVDVLLSADGDGSEGVIDLAARLGLESTGISLPIAKTAKEMIAPESEPMLVLIGTSHPVVDQLIKNKKWEAPALQPGEGLVQVVKKAFGEKSALVVTGGDATGVRRAVHQLAETFPHIWQRGKDRTTLDDVEDDVRKFVAGRSPAGQAAMSLYKLDKIAAQLRGKDLASARVTIGSMRSMSALTESPLSGGQAQRPPATVQMSPPSRAEYDAGRRRVTREGLMRRAAARHGAHLRRTDLRAAASQEHASNKEASSSQPAASGTPASSGGARAGRGAGVSVGSPRCRRIRSITAASSMSAIKRDLSPGAPRKPDRQFGIVDVSFHGPRATTSGFPLGCVPASADGKAGSYRRKELEMTLN